MPNPLVDLLCLGGREWEWERSAGVAVAGFVLNMGGRGNFMSLN